MNITESITKIPVHEEMVDRLLLSIELEKKANYLFQSLMNLIEYEKEEWIEITNKGYYYNPSVNLIMVNPKKVKLSATKFIDTKDLKWCPMHEWIVIKYFYELQYKNPIIDDGNIIYVDESNIERSSSYMYCQDTNRCFNILNCSTLNGGISYTDAIKLPYYSLNTTEKESIVEFLLDHNFNIFKDIQLANLFNLFVSLNKSGFLEFDGQKASVSINSFEDYEYACNECAKASVMRDAEKEELLKELQSDSYVLPEDIKEIILQELLDCDKKRVNMESYSAHTLEDPESGHWELWEEGNHELSVGISRSVVARNPVFDALENKSGVVGIDFGTKSTVVTYRQSRADIMPMRIGSGRFSRAATKSDYENPTVMEVRNARQFIRDYKENIGRPNTQWEDLLISHEAAEQMKSEQSQGDTFATFFSELKQWASDKTRQVKIRDLQGAELNIPSYLSVSEADFDPIEIYAYYLGLFINNMIHKIYLRYKLSFPATVEKKVRDKILLSFTKGIKKSLPKQVIEDETCMKIFKVEQGASEPAAYAITALQEYGFDPEEDEKHYYGIFDFGGGTTDFDFGIWSSEEKEPENYDYQISHFGQGGDPYLGGENLLEIMSYHAFMNNYDKLLADKIVFIRPFGEKEIAGKNYLVVQDSQFAHFNQKRMMEKLRGVWEGEEETRRQVESGTIEVPLFSMDGTVRSNYSIDIDLEALDSLLEERIEKGVSQFFDALKNCFGVNENQKDIHNVNEVNIFLAGNSSKSPIIYKMFKKYIDLLSTRLGNQDGEEREWFKLYPPLGTPQSNAIINGELTPLVDDIIAFNNTIGEGTKEEGAVQGKTGYNFSADDLQKPTGKTGVAFGLLNNRVRVVQNESEEIGFRYYIGQNRKNKFYCAIDKDNQKYNEWVRFCAATKEEFDIWFTRSATAPTNKVPIGQIGIYSEVGFVENPSEDKSVFIRLTSPTDIEYIVSTEEEIRNDTYSKDRIDRVSLQEKQ